MHMYAWVHMRMLSIGTFLHCKNFQKKKAVNTELSYLRGAMQDRLEHKCSLAKFHNLWNMTNKFFFLLSLRIEAT